MIPPTKQFNDSQLCRTAHALNEMLEAWEEQFGPEACDCMPEPENAGHVCQCCLARNALLNLGYSHQPLDDDHHAMMNGPRIRQSLGLDKPTENQITELANRMTL